MLDELILGESVFLAASLASLALGTVAHEFGHAIAARAVGLTPRLVSVGQGPIVGRFRWASAWVVLRLVPISGFSHTLFEPGTTARQRFITTAAGPAVNVVALAAATLARAVGPDTLFAHMAGEGVMAGQALILLSSLVPYARKTKEGYSTSDAMWLWRLARGKHAGAFAAQRAVLLRRHLAEGEASPPASRHWPEIVFQRMRRDRKHDAWAQDDGAETLRAILAHEDLPDAERRVAVELLELTEQHRRVRALKAKLAALKRGENVG